MHKRQTPCFSVPNWIWSLSANVDGMFYEVQWHSVFLPYVCVKIFAGEKLANHEIFAKHFLANIHRYAENVFGIAMHSNSSKPIPFTCMVCQNFPTKIFSCSYDSFAVII